MAQSTHQFSSCSFRQRRASRLRLPLRRNPQRRWRGAGKTRNWPGSAWHSHRPHRIGRAAGRASACFSRSHAAVIFARVPLNVDRCSARLHHRRRGQRQPHDCVPFHEDAFCVPPLFVSRSAFRQNEVEPALGFSVEDPVVLRRVVGEHRDRLRHNPPACPRPRSVVGRQRLAERIAG
jgi:hypothetical protein